MAAQFVIDVADDGTATLTIDGGDPLPVESVQQACEAIEEMQGASEPEAQEAQEEQGAFAQATQDKMPPPRQKPNVGGQQLAGMGM